MCWLLLKDVANLENQLLEQFHKCNISNDIITFYEEISLSNYEEKLMTIITLYTQPKRTECLE